MNQNTVIKYSVDMSRKDLRKTMADFTLDLAPNKKGIRRFRIVFIILAAILLGLFAVSVATPGKVSWFDFVFCIIFLGFAFAIKPIKKSQVLKAINTSYPDHTVNYEVSEEEIRTASPVAEHHLKWDMFRAVWENEDFLILSGINMQAAVCPKKELAAEELSALHEIIKDQIQEEPASK